MSKLAAPPLPTSPLSPPVPDRPGRRIGWRGLHGSAAALAIARAAAAHGAPTLVVTPDPRDARRLEQALRFYAPDPERLPVLVFPDWETLPYDVFSPHQDIVSDRLTALYRLPNLRRGVLIVPAATLMQRLPPRGYLDAGTLVLDVGDRLDLEDMRGRLERAGYRCVTTVLEHGEFAVRGGILDLYPMGSETPYRIELFDDEVESMRGFDPETQRSDQPVEHIRLLPAREFPLDPPGRDRFRNAWLAAFGDESGNAPLFREVRKGSAPGGVEYYLPLFFEATNTLFDYLPEDALAVTLEGVETAAEAAWKEIGERYEAGRHNRERPLLPPQRLHLQAHELLGRLKDLRRVRVGTDPNDAVQAEFATQPPPDLGIDARGTHPLRALSEFLQRFNGEQGGRALFAAETPGRREALLDLLRGADLQPQAVTDWEAFATGDERLAICVAPLENGLLLADQPPAAPLAVIVEPQLFGAQVMQRRRRQKAVRDTDNVIRNLTELNIGAPVVHEDYGVGRYLGLQVLQVGDLDTEYLTLEYAGGEKLYVPVSNLQLIGRYTGMEPEHAPLHRLGSGKWERAKRKAAEKVRDVAAELLDIYSRRAARKGHAFDLDEESYAAFAADFPFEVTPDQEEAIDAVLADMHGGKPMDRVICGDVGFGKTEVAMRAAFVAVQAGYQVALLVPTTLLAQQHFENFTDRFADWPVRVESLSRFRTAKQQTGVLQALTEGQVDIVIGTHKLLQPNVQFKRLGLVVLDEEHRFGVRQKERLKSLRAEVDVLTMTATPIPRTLNLSLSGMRDLSIIATPPPGRLAIKTFVQQWDAAQLREAMLREVHRGGQVYFLHNQVDTIEKTAREVEKLLPEGEVRIAHGQMHERELERVMSDFYHQRFNVLVCTTIIETGIDVPSANTIVIDRADRLGLAQLYQLRGRVGRSHHRAYAYLVVPDKRALTNDAVKRLEAIEALEDLGVGFTLATHDLEIRGAGELLGENQSGQMQEVGFTLYTEMLGRAVEALKSGRQPELDRPLDHAAEVDLRVPALIPEDYLADVHTRLIMYKRIAGCETSEQLHDLQVEMIDRFGLLPDPVKTLFSSAELKLKAHRLGIRKVEAGPAGGRLIFGDRPKVDPDRIIGLIQQDPGQFRLDGQDKLRLVSEMPDAAARIRAMDGLLDQLGMRHRGA